MPALLVALRKVLIPGLALLMVLFAPAACRESGRVDAATLHQTPEGPRLRVTILGSPSDSRVGAVREAIAYWNGELGRLGRAVRLDSGSIRAKTIPDSILHAATGEVMLGRGPATTRLRASLANVPGDIVIALSDTTLISYGMPWHVERPGIVALRRSDVLPLTLPNTLRNVIAHELGHVLGLMHNLDATTLMCGRPASCRPATFASDSAHFFPLSASDEKWLRKRWP